jgi:hypothetical protein
MRYPHGQVSCLAANRRSRKSHSEKKRNPVVDELVIERDFESFADLSFRLLACARVKETRLPGLGLATKHLVMQRQLLKHARKFDLLRLFAAPTARSCTQLAPDEHRKVWATLAWSVADTWPHHDAQWRPQCSHWPVVPRWQRARVHAAAKSAFVPVQATRAS